MTARKMDQVVRAARRLGLPWLAYRGWKAFADRTGWTRQRLPIVHLFSVSLEDVATVSVWRDAAHFFSCRQNHGTKFLWDRVPEPSELARFDSSNATFRETIERLQGGRFSYFSSTIHEMGNPPDWFRNPYFDTVGARDAHFSRLGDFQFGDIKAIWELSRFGFVFELARAFARTRDPRCGQLFWKWFEDWCRQNPVNQGVNWKCGQETALRAIAITFGAWIFGDDSEATPDRLALLSKLMHHSALRIEKYIRYALHQNNNHSISEAAGLFAIGLLYPELHRAAYWRIMGQRLLEQETERLFFEDGGFVQFSSNYQRLAMQLLSFCMRLAQRNEMILSERMRSRVEASVRNMANWVDADSGGAPRFGNDDGALLFPLSHCTYEDFRPALQSAAAIALERRIFEAGPWDEELVWMGVEPEILPLNPWSPQDMIGGEGGISVLQGNQGRAVFRCGPSPFRPAQLDLFHVDLWQRGKNLALDPGTYSYNASGIFSKTPFAEARFHNTVRLNCREPADRIGVFLFDPWPAGKVIGLKRSPDGRIGLLRGERLDHFVAQRPVLHRRSILRLDGMGWFVIDEIYCDFPIPNCLHWLLDSSYSEWKHAPLRVLFSPRLQNYLTLATEPGWQRSTMELGCADSPMGWYSDRYLNRQPAVSVSLETQAACNTRMYSLFADEPAELDDSENPNYLMRFAWKSGQLELNFGNNVSGSLNSVKFTLNRLSSELSF